MPSYTFQQLVAYVAALPRDQALAALARLHNLDVVSVSWQDIARSAHSCWGSGIADFTLAVMDAAPASARLPFFKPNNFSDLTSDWPLAALPFPLRVGNTARGWDGATLSTVSLADVLANVRAYIGPTGNVQEIGDLRASPDGSEQVLVASQICVLPAPVDDFCLACQPYGARKLVIVSTSQGTTFHLVDGYTTTQLYYAHGDKRATWRAWHLKKERADKGKDLHAAMDEDETARNMLVVIQVPLEAPPQAPRSSGYGGGSGVAYCYYGGYAGSSSSGMLEACGGGLSIDDITEKSVTLSSSSKGFSKGGSRSRGGAGAAPVAMGAMRSAGSASASVFAVAGSAAAAGASAMAGAVGAVAASFKPAPKAAALPSTAAATATPPPAADPATYGFGHAMIATNAPKDVPFAGGFSAGGYKIVRDKTKPLRVTLCMYACTDNLTAEMPPVFMALLSSMVYGPLRVAAALGQGHGSLVVDDANRASRATAVPHLPPPPAPVAAAAASKGSWFGSWGLRSGSGGGKSAADAAAEAVTAANAATAAAAAAESKYKAATSTAPPPLAARTRAHRVCD